MENEKLAQGVKELRKVKGLSQEELAKKSVLSLRTIQRLENGETVPTGETLRRISAVLEVTPRELIEWDCNRETLNRTVKTKYEYLHIFDNKLAITNTLDVNDLVGDYGKSVGNFFKSLMVFFVFIPIFTALAVIFYNTGRVGLAINTGAYAFFFLTIAFYTMLFTSGSSLIKMESISKIKIQRKLFNYVVVILYKESGRLKNRTLILQKSQVETMKDALLLEKLIEEKDIKLKRNKIFDFVFAAMFIIIPNLVNFKYNGSKSLNLMMYNGLCMILISVILIIIMVKRSITPLLNKNNKPFTRS